MSGAVEVTQASEWLRAIGAWLLETDNDMKLPSGVLDTDPLDIAEDLLATEATFKAREAELVEALGEVIRLAKNHGVMSYVGVARRIVAAEAIIARANATPDKGEG